MFFYQCFLQCRNVDRQQSDPGLNCCQKILRSGTGGLQGINRLMDCVQIMGIGAAQVIAMLQIGELLLKQCPVRIIFISAQESD